MCGTRSMAMASRRHAGSWHYTHSPAAPHRVGALRLRLGTQVAAELVQSGGALALALRGRLRQRGGTCRGSSLGIWRLQPTTNAQCPAALGSTAVPTPLPRQAHHHLAPLPLSLRLALEPAQRLGTQGIRVQQLEAAAGKAVQ